MELPLKFFFFVIFLGVAMGQSENESVEKPEDESRQFHIEEHKETRETIKTDMDGYFLKLWEMLTIKLEKSQAAFSANLSREFNENMGNLYTNLSDSITQKLSSSDLKVETSLRNLSKIFEQKFVQSDLKVTRELKNLDETLHRNHQQLLSTIFNRTMAINPNPMTMKPNLTTFLNPNTVTTKLNLTEVEEVRGERGTIEFVGGAKSNLRTKIWVLRSEGGNSFRRMSFMLDKNKLGDGARLFLWGSEKSNPQMWNGSQIDWKKERTASGHVILVTLVISPSAAETPSFKLKFNTTSTSSTYIYSSEVLLGEGRGVVSFPPSNDDNYPPKSFFTALIARRSGEPFALTLKYLEIPGTPPDSCGYNNFDVWFLEESPTGVQYKQLPFSEYRRCGRVGFLSEHLLNSTVAIIRFYNYGGNDVGRGFRVDVN